MESMANKISSLNTYLQCTSSLCFDNDKLLPHSTPEERIHTSFHPAGDTEPIWLTHPDAFSLVYIGAGWGIRPWMMFNKFWLFLFFVSRMELISSDDERNFVFFFFSSYSICSCNTLVNCWRGVRSQKKLTYKNEAAAGVSALK